MGGPYWGSRLCGERFGGMMKAADRKLVGKILKVEDYNDYHIKCVGKRVTIKLDGTTTVDERFAKMPDEGVIAFQIHSGPAMEVIFCNIRLVELNETKRADRQILQRLHFSSLDEPSIFRVV